MTQVRQPVVQANNQNGSVVDANAYRNGPLGNLSTDADGRGRNQQHDKPSDSMVDALAFQIANLDQAGIIRAVRNLERVQRSYQIPTDSPLATVGQFARPATFQRGSLLRRGFSHAPWNGGRDGSNLSTSGKPFAFQSEGYVARGAFNGQSSDIPSEWVKENLEPEMNNARVNADKPYMRNLLAAGRYSHIRV